MAPLITLAALASTAFAAVLDTRQSGLGRRTDTYDDLATLPGAPQLSAVGTYNSLLYNGWVVARPGIPFLDALCFGNTFCLGTLGSGLRPQSGRQVAATGIVETLTQIGEITMKPFGTIAAGNDIGSFNLNSFYFGCIANTGQSLVIPAIGCTITVTGFYTTGLQAPAQRYTFTPTTRPQAPLALATLPLSYSASLVGLENVTIGIAEADLTPGLAVLDIDNLVHVNRLI
ncbi:hypothetical protein Slin14017_G097640 [Septoria linicola]|nr:hypothetical protein Slin14017_G097640 [Septoria linicola]